MIGTGEDQRICHLQCLEANRINGREMQFVAHALERCAEPRRGDRAQLGKRPKLRLDACDDGAVDGRDPAVRAM